jgi:hypothetical protein
MVLGSIPQSKKDTNSENTEKLVYYKSPLGKNETLGNIQLEDLGINASNHEVPSNEEYKVILEAEDEDYWEVEKLGDTYYKVKREDRDKDLHGPDEFETEEEIGSWEDLCQYALDHNRIINVISK